MNDYVSSETREMDETEPGRAHVFIIYPTLKLAKGQVEHQNVVL